MMNEQGTGGRNGYREGEMSFREWLPTYEREQEHHSNQIAGLIQANSHLSAEVATISANVQTLLKNQSTFTERLNRPWQWGVVVAVFLGIFSMAGAFATVLGLTVDPIKASIKEAFTEHKTERENQMEINMWLRDTIENNRVQLEKTRSDVEWIIKMEERYNNRIHP